LSIDVFCDPARPRAEAVQRMLNMPRLDLPDDPADLEAELDAMYDDQ
jgi:hypothetical protein